LTGKSTSSYNDLSKPGYSPLLKKKNAQKAVEAMKQHMLEEQNALVAALEKGKT